MNSGELLDIIDTNDNVIGQADKTEVYRHSLGFRVINGFLVNDNKQVWIPRRCAHKKLFPLCLDASVGGHVMSGESYEQAFVRELAEELNINAQNIPYKLIAKLNPLHDQVSAHMHVYIIRTNQSPQYNTNDFSQAGWFNMHEILSSLKNGEQAKGDLLTLLLVLQAFLNKV